MIEALMKEAISRDWTFEKFVGMFGFDEDEEDETNGTDAAKVLWDKLVEESESQPEGGDE